MTGYQSKRAAAQDKLAQPAQKPVAWMWRCKPYYDYPNWEVSLKRPADSGRDGNKKTDGYEDVPLYAAPPQPAQKPVAWLEPEWGEKICPEVGYEVTMTDDHPKDLGWIPLAAQPEQEPVAWQLWVGADTPPNAPMGWHFYNTYDSLRSAEVSARTINSYKQSPFAKVVPLYTAPPQRPWVGLTDKEAQLIYDMGRTPTGMMEMVEAKLKEKNNG